MVVVVALMVDNKTDLMAVQAGKVMARVLTAEVMELSGH